MFDSIEFRGRMPTHSPPSAPYMIILYRRDELFSELCVEWSGQIRNIRKGRMHQQNRARSPFSPGVAKLRHTESHDPLKASK